MQQIFLEVAGLTWRNQCYQLYSNKSDNIYAKKILPIPRANRTNKIIGLNIGSSQKQIKKRWNIKKFIALINIINFNYSSWEIVILAGPEEADLYEKLHSLYNQIFFKYYFPRVS